MKKSALLFILLSVLMCCLSLDSLHSETFGSGDNIFNIDFVNIGDPNNSPYTLIDNRGPSYYGGVSYEYGLSIYSISQNQIDLAKSNGLTGVYAGAWSGNKPAANITWYEAATFVNWLNTSKGFHQAYNLSDGTPFSAWNSWDTGYDPSNTFRNKGAKYVLPSEDEWFKAAYYGGGGSYTVYPTGNQKPQPVSSGTNAGSSVYYSSSPADVNNAGGPSGFGVIGIGGNVTEWMEGNYNRSDSSPASPRAVRGNSFKSESDVPLMANQRGYMNPSWEGIDMGFRVVSLNTVPEPSTYALFGLGAVGVLMVMRRKKTA